MWLERSCQSCFRSSGSFSARESQGVHGTKCLTSLQHQCDQVTKVQGVRTLTGGNPLLAEITMRNN